VSSIPRLSKITPHAHICKSHEPGALLNANGSVSAPMPLAALRQSNCVSEELQALALQTRVEALLKQQVDAVRDEFSRRYAELEVRLANDIEDAKSTIDKQVESLDIRTAEKVVVLQEELRRNRSQSRDVAEPSLNAVSEIEIADQVLERVKADPRFCKVMENHQSLQESFLNLLEMLDRERRNEQKEHAKLRGKVVEVQTCYDSIAVEMRSVRERRIQDVSDIAIRLQTLEKLVKDIDRPTLDSSHGDLFKCFDAKYQAIFERPL